MVNSDPKKAIWTAYSIKDDGTIEHGRVFLDATNWGKQEEKATRWPEGESGRESLCHRSRGRVKGGVRAHPDGVACAETSLDAVTRSEAFRGTG